MAEWNKGKVLPSAINGGKEFTESDNLALDELNAIVNNSFYASELVENSIQEVNNAAAQGKAELGLVVEQGKSELGDVVGDASELVEDAKNHINTVVDTANRAEETAKLAEEKIDSFIKTNGGTLVYVEGELKTLWRADFVENERKKSKNLFDVNAFLNKSEHTTVNGNVITQAAGGNGELDSIWDLIPVSEFYVYQGGLSGLAYFSMNIKTTGDRIVRLRFYDKNRNIVVPTKIPEYWIYDDSYKCVYKKFNNEEVVGSCRLDHLDPNDGIEYFAFCTLWLPQEQTISNVMFTVYNDIVELSDYQPYHGQITHNGDAPVAFAEAERIKTLNLCNNEMFEWGDIVSQGTVEQYSNTVIRTKNYIPVKPNAKYFLGVGLTAESVGLKYYSDKQLNSAVGAKDVLSNQVVTIPDGCHYLRIASRLSDVSVDITKQQYYLYEGTIDYGYLEYNGAIVHEKDIADVEHYETIYNIKTKNVLNDVAYTNGILIGTNIVSNEFAGYKALIVKSYRNQTRLTTEINLSGDTGNASGTPAIDSSGDYFVIHSFIFYKSNNSFVFEHGGYMYVNRGDATFVKETADSDNRIVEILGVK